MIPSDGIFICRKSEAYYGNYKDKSSYIASGHIGCKIISSKEKIKVGVA